MDKLDSFLTRYDQQPFDWQENNCAQFAGRWVLEKTGLDPLSAEWHILIRSGIRRALRALRDAGGYVAAADRALGAHVMGRYAARGNVVLVKTPRARRHFGWSWGVCTGNRVAVLGRTGVDLLPLSAAEVAWRV